MFILQWVRMLAHADAHVYIKIRGTAGVTRSIELNNSGDDRERKRLTRRNSLTSIVDVVIEFRPGIFRARTLASVGIIKLKSALASRDTPCTKCVSLIVMNNQHFDKNLPFFT